MTESESPAPESRTPRWLGAWADWRRKRCWLLIAFLLYSLVGLFLAPRLISNAIVDEVAATQRSATVGLVRVNPFLFTLLIEEIDIDDTDGADLLSIEHYFADWEVASLFNWALTFKEIRLTGLEVYEERFSGLDTRWMRWLTDISASETDSAETTESEPPPRAIIRLFRFQAHSLTIMDRTAGDFEATFGPIDITVADLQTVPQQKGQQTITINTVNGGQIDWTGQIQLVPLASQGTIVIRGKSLAEMFRYSEHYLPYRTMGDGVNISLKYDAKLIDDEFNLLVSDINGESTGNKLIPDGHNEPLFSADKTILKGGRMAWPEQTFSLESMTMIGPELELVQESDGSINVMNLFAELLTEPEGATGSANEPASEPWDVSLSQFTIENGTINVQDQMREPAVALSVIDANLAMSSINLRDGSLFPTQLELGLSTGGRVQWNGEIGAFPELNASGQVEVNDLNIMPAQSYVTDFINIQLKSGLLTLGAEVAHGPAQQLAAQGRMKITGLEITDGLLDERLLGFESMSVERFDTDLSGNAVTTSPLIFDGLFGRLHIDENYKTNVEGLIVEQAPAVEDQSSADGATASSEAASAMAISLSGISFNNAALDFSDFSLPLPFSAAMRSMNGNISALSTSSSEPARLDLEGQVNEFGLARIDGEISANDIKEATDVSMVFRNLEMSKLSPYTVSFAGYAIESGKLDLDLQYSLQKSELKGANSVIVRELTLGEKIDHPDAGSLPLGLAVALLKDSNGVIDIDLPVEGNVDEPEFKIGGVVLAAIGNLITKAVTAPFRFLGSLIGVDSEDFGILRFAAGRSDIRPPDREQLTKLLEAMQLRPELVLEIAGSYAPSLDRPALAELAVKQLVEEQMAEQGIAIEDLTGEAQILLLETLFTRAIPSETLESLRAEFTPPVNEEAGVETAELDENAYIAGLRRRLIEAQSIPDSALLELAQQRAESTLAVLTELASDTPLAASIIPPEQVEQDGESEEILLELTVSAESGKS